MNRIHIPILLILSLLPTQAGWESLFNGKNLAGWKGDPRLWRVENQTLVGETNHTDKKITSNTFLIWEGGEPGDFDLEYEARVTGGNNSGVQYRSKVLDEKTWVVGGYQMDLHPNAPYLGMLYEEKGRGISCQRGQRVKLDDKPKVVGTLDIQEVDLGKWNSYQIVARGNLLRHYVNGKLAAEIRDVSKTKSATSGVIALQVHAGKPMRAEFRNIRIRRIEEPAADTKPTASWIWKSPAAGKHEKVLFRREFQLPPEVSDAWISVSCDNSYQLFLNGREIGGGSDWTNPQNFQVLPAVLQGGRNLIAVSGHNDGGAAGLALRFHATLPDGKALQVFTDSNWLCSGDAAKGWQSAGFNPKGWAKAAEVASFGGRPWGNVLPPPPTPARNFEDMTDTCTLAPGFKLERIYQVPRNEGSWVGLTADDKGRFFCTDQSGKIYRLTLPPGGGGPPLVEALDIPLRGAHGLLWHQGVLWACVNQQSGKGGVWKITGSNADGLPDQVEWVKALKGSGEHGPHSLALAPDGKSIYVIAGNSTELPEMDQSLVPRLWAEDQLLPRRPDARGHARNRMAPGAWIARFDLDGKNWQLFSIGYRNPFDLAFNEFGDLFSYDSDMEWDLGMPWYRPTRVCHVTPGSEFGWRNGTGKWPDYYEDAMPSQLDIGPGSPTGMVSGKGARFPASYQRAVFGLDWTFATLYAFHLVPDGAGYRAEREEFLSGSGLPLTDAVIGNDGAMYFLTGGRNAQSALWRISYTGSESTEPVAYQSKPLALMDAAAAPSALGSGDRVERFNARIAMEHQGPEKLRELIKLPTSKPWQVIDGAIGLARVGTADDKPVILDSLERLDWANLDVPQKVNWLRALGLVFARHGEPDPAMRQRVIACIDSSFPANDPLMNRELCRMLAYLQAPRVVARTLTLMDTAGPSPTPDWLALAERNARYGKTVKEMIANLPPAQIIHYAYCLRVVKGPWHPDERKRFFGWLDKLTANRGGMSYGGFIADLRKETLAACTPEEREWIAKLETRPVANPFANLPPIQGPGRDWTIDEVVKTAGEGLSDGNRERGRDLFRASLCAACHRFGNEGGAVGPDLTTLGGRFTVRDLAVSIVDPGNVISDQYQFDLITRADGTEMTGRVIEKTDSKWVIATNPFDASQLVEIPAAEIRSSRPSPVSPMPPGLINRLNPAELKDLLAYLLGS